MTNTVAIRSLLFLPGNRPELVPKLERFRPDVAVLDLEDAVAEADKTAARALIADSATLAADLGITCLVRVNPPGTRHFAADLAVAADSRAAGVVLPKYERPSDVAAVRERLSAGSAWASGRGAGSAGASGRGADRLVVVGVETVLGVADARPLLAEPVSAAYFGAEDYIADIGGRRTPGGEEVLYARSAVAAAAHLSGVPAIDQAVVELGDDEHFLRDARKGRDIGYTGKICIHPRQVTLAAQVFTPTAEEAEHARRILSAGASGVAAFDGQMIDEPHLRQARRTLALYDRYEEQS